MPRSYRGDKFILCIIDEVTYYLITIPIHSAKSKEIGDGLIENVITKYCIPEYIIMDQDSAFMSSLINYLFHKFDIKIETVAPYNHQSLQAEHGIKSFSNVLTIHLTNLGQIWPKYLHLATFAHKTFNSSLVVSKHGLYAGSLGSIPTAITTRTAAGGDAEHVSLNH